MMLSEALSLCTLTLGVQGWEYEKSFARGIPYNGTQGTLFREASKHPNATVSVPLLIGSENVTFRVNVSTLALPGVDTNLTDPEAVLTTWDLTWPNREKVNNISCLTVYGGPVKPQGASQNGNCSTVLSADCLASLTGESFNGCAGSPAIPPSCRALSAITGSYSCAIVGPYDNMSSPVTLFSSDSSILPGDGVKKPYQSALQQWQVGVLTTSTEPLRAYAVCAKVSSGVSSWNRVSVRTSLIAAFAGTLITNFT